MSYDPRNNWGAVIANEMSIRDSADATLGLARAEGNLLAQQKRALQNEQSADDGRLIMQLSVENKKLKELDTKKHQILKAYLAQAVAFKKLVSHLEESWGPEKAKEIDELHLKLYEETWYKESKELEEKISQKLA